AVSALWGLGRRRVVVPDDRRRSALVALPGERRAGGVENGYDGVDDFGADAASRKQRRGNAFWFCHCKDWSEGLWAEQSLTGLCTMPCETGHSSRLASLCR